MKKPLNEGVNTAVRVAIVGAGVSGLACAYGLERLGINPVIFERRFTVGDFHLHCGITLRLFDRSLTDLFFLPKNNYGITLFPLNNINQIILYGQNRKTAIHDALLGYTFLKGQDENSIENQLRRLIKSKINFNVHADYKVLSKEYDCVVIASGNNLISEDLGIWRTTMQAFVKGAIILGSFNPQAIYLWFNRQFVGSGYGYMIPFDAKRATLGLMVPCADPNDIDRRWELFLKAIKLDNPIVETFQQDVTMGYCVSHKVGNLYFTGNAAGFLNPVICSGMIVSILSGLYAAMAIAQKADYEKMLKPFVEQINTFTVLRNYLDRLDDRGFDEIIKLSSISGISRIFYSSNVDVWRWASKLLSIGKRGSIKSDDNI